VISIDSKTDKKRIIDALKLFKDVKKVSVATDEELENLSILKACKAGRKTKKISKSELLKAL
jgi:hypothetical protein